jgi:transposase-like protein
MERTEAEENWRSLIAKQEASGLSVAAWCREHDVIPQTMYWWRSELKRRDAAEAALAFVPIEVVGDVRPQAVGGLRVIAGGREVIVASDFDEELLSRLILLLESLPC